MCGIYCTVFYFDDTFNNDEIINKLRNRGPDFCRSTQYVHSQFKLIFYGTVLWMQGPALEPQPVEDEFGILLFNGDIFDKHWCNDICDTLQILDQLKSVEQINPFDRREHILSVFRSLKGPFSLIYYDKITNLLYFTRDKIGRNSLLFHQNERYFCISSVLDRNHKCIEVPASNIHVINLNDNIINLYSWNEEKVETLLINKWVENIQVLQSLPDAQFELDLEFSSIPEDDWVSFVQDALTQTNSKLLCMEKLLENVDINNTVLKLLELLEASVQIRIDTQPHMCQKCITFNNEFCNHCTVGVLFSGGLDCTILAFLVDKFLTKDRPIDLINVAFRKDANISYEVPDRITGRQSFEELKKLRPLRNWVFHEVNVPSEELKYYQKTKIADLVHPRQTILDESIGSAFWFAARGKNKNSISPCRILLLGSGADELFGGYTRHRNAFKRSGWPGLNKELMLDWKRISFRNLARDNRVICDHGKQPRLPYLDDDFTNYVLKLKPWQRCFPVENLGPGIGDKLILRLLAFKLGLVNVSTFPKRALQFGSRIANKKERGSDLSKNFLHN